ncbi:MAG: hypothetical protein HN741_05835 [Anaerolineae bacterium]|nr:hypothetical protein [Anaerolineae bacterium]
METGNVHEAARKIDYAVSELEMKPRRMRGVASNLKSAWRGRKASKMASELKQHAKVLGEEVANLSFLAQRVRNEINEWEAADSLGAANWNSREFYETFTFQDNETNTQDEDEFNWLGWSGAVGGGGAGVVVDVLRDAQKVPLKDYKSVGRTINKLIGNQRGGYVGKMDKLGHLVKSVDDDALKKMEYAGIGFSFGMGVWDDLSDGDNAFHAVFSEGLETALNIGIKTGIKYLIPGAGTAMLIYDASLLAGRLVAGGMEVFGFHDEAVWLQNAIDVIDIGTYTDKIGDGVSDFVENAAKKIWDWL